MKYIDAEKLLAEIERLHKAHSGKYGCDEVALNLEHLEDFITSLQQEPRFPQYDNIVEKVFGAGNLEGFEYHEAEMLVALAKEELLKSLQQEQPEVDIEREIDEHSEQMPMSEFTHESEAEGFIEWAKGEFRHFYELGLNARKEE